MKYIYLPAGRRVWSDVAELLATEAGWEPTIWLGDNASAAVARERYPNCVVYDFWACNRGELPATERRSEAIPPGILLSERFSALKLQAMKMMDRQDLSGRFRYLEREALFYRLASHFYGQVQSREVTRLIAAEAPHSAAQYIVFDLCGILGIPTLFFSSSSVVPVLFAKNAIGSPPIPLPELLDPAVKGPIAGSIKEFCASFVAGAYDDIEPGYMKAQRAADKKRESRIGGAWYAIKPVLVRAKKASLGRNAGSYLIDDSALQTVPAESPPTASERPLAVATQRAADVVSAVASETSRRLRVERLRRQLKEAYARNVSESVPSSDYAFFPLHYEPERTTNPEGGLFTSQYDAILTLRSELPEGVALVIKEHPSQFSHVLHGYLGRSAMFYDVVRRLPNTFFVRHNQDPIALMKGAKFVATITGTAALEAACSGRRALVFGDPWFAGCPGVSSYVPGVSLEELLNPADWKLDDIERFLLRLVESHGVLGCVNPSSEGAFPAYADRLAGAAAARQVASAILSAVRAAGEAASTSATAQGTAPLRS